MDDDTQMSASPRLQELVSQWSGSKGDTPRFPRQSQNQPGPELGWRMGLASIAPFGSTNGALTPTTTQPREAQAEIAGLVHGLEKRLLPSVQPAKHFSGESDERGNQDDGPYPGPARLELHRSVSEGRSSTGASVCLKLGNLLLASAVRDCLPIVARGSQQHVEQHAEEHHHAAWQQMA
eukprot:CAMPEP_0202080610 /NCGR_PEP_ID=MMETSP0964-20121228/9321_1 /ASSEMBLY_ACC=CAM_ASM_000500 /TAXON_ID=4773 /ORGANISM="Schizochytrium aggregatum, Strain ATCC28209" /LENGTH=178 /DNA_ID=CAMNT_0048648051 /DNA_START=328 /DNA_END=862 /DNA_ORIENTATION=-